MNKFIPLSIFCLLCSLLSFGQSEATYQQKGDSFLTEGAFNEYIDYFTQELKKHPNNEDILRHLGYAHIGTQDFELSIQYYTQALKINPKCLNCYGNLASVYIELNDYKTAIEYIEKAIALEPESAVSYLLRAEAKKYLDDDFGAVIDYNKAIELEPNNYEFYIARGLYNAQKGYYALAISDLSTAIELAPNEFYPNFERAQLYYQLQRMEEAFTDINQAISIDNSHYASYIIRGDLYYFKGEIHQSIEDYTTSLTLNENEFYAYSRRARSYYTLEDMDASCADYESIERLIEKGIITEQELIDENHLYIENICKKDKPSYYYQRGIAAYNLKNYEKALSFYNQGLEKFPNHSMTHSFKGNALLALEQYEEAIKHYQIALKFKDHLKEDISSNPGYTNTTQQEINQLYQGFLADIYFSSAESRFYLEQFYEAMHEINIAIKEVPRIKEIPVEAFYNLRGYIHLHQNNYKEALADFNASIQINNDFDLAYVNRAIAKVSLADKIKTKTYSVRKNIKFGGLQTQWDTPRASVLKKIENELLEALEDCDKALSINPELSYGYLIRGQIKQLLGYQDYCLDFLAAQKYGMEVDAELMSLCQ